MESFLLITYSVIFAALIIYVLHLRSRLTTLEQRLEDLRGEPEQGK